MPAILRPHLAWWQRTRTEPPTLPPMVVGGVAIPPPEKLTEFGCHYCPETFAEPEPCLHHMWAEHGRDRRRSERRSAAA